MSRPGIATGLSILLTALGTLSAQTEGVVPQPPPPGRVSAPPLEGPSTDLEPMPADNSAPDSKAAEHTDSTVASHDALRGPDARPRANRVHTARQAPAPVAERPSGARPEPRAQWVSGYWDWDPARSEFFWIGGLWQVPPPGSIWVGGRWLRDQEGWYRVPGYWSRRREQSTVEISFMAANKPAWRTTGPPDDRPIEQATAAPGPDYFFVQGHYAPDGDQVIWKPGFWARSQPGWDWAPARWVRRATGWEFRAGHWVQEPDARDLRTTRRPSDLTPGADGSPPPPVIEDEDDPVDNSNEPGLPGRNSGRVVVVPRSRMPFYVIRPPGMYPYGPGGVVVPGAVPGFVRDILDQVLP